MSPTLAECIVEYLRINTCATLPEIRESMNRSYKGLGTAFRKLEELGYIKRIGKIPTPGGHNPQTLFLLSGVEIDPVKLSDGRGKAKLNDIRRRKQHTFSEYSPSMIVNPFGL